MSNCTDKSTKPNRAHLPRIACDQCGRRGIFGGDRSGDWYTTAAGVRQRSERCRYCGHVRYILATPDDNQPWDRGPVHVPWDVFPAFNGIETNAPELWRALRFANDDAAAGMLAHEFPAAAQWITEHPAEWDHGKVVGFIAYPPGSQWHEPTEAPANV